MDYEESISVIKKGTFITAFLVIDLFIFNDLFNDKVKAESW